MLLALDPVPVTFNCWFIPFADDDATECKSLGEKWDTSAKTQTGRTIGPMNSAIVQLIPKFSKADVAAHLNVP